MTTTVTSRDAQTTPTRNDVRRRVTAQRKLSYGSVRKAAEAAGISNTTWGSYEAGTAELTDKIRRGVARAFGWPDDWPENPPAVEEASPADLAGRVATLEERMRDIEMVRDVTMPRMAELEADLARGWDALAEVTAEVRHLTDVVRRIAGPVPPDSELPPELSP